MRPRLARIACRPLVVGSILAVLIIAGGGTYWLTAATGSKSGSADLTEIKSGLSAGAQVVLADLGEPLPSGGFSAANNRGGVFGGGLGGGGGLGRATRDR
jgi:hypothetical protein